MRCMGILLTACVLDVAAACSAATIRVPEDSPSVLVAVDAAAPGDTVLVGPGLWTDSATRTVVTRFGADLVKACAFPRGGIVIRGSGVGSTTLDVGGSVSAVPAVLALAEEVGEGVLVVESMTLTGAVGNGLGAGIYGLFGDGLDLRSCRLQGNDAAVSVVECPLAMEDCEVLGNSDDFGIVRVRETPVHMTRCVFEGNTGLCLTTIYYPGDGPAVFQDCEFVRNRGRGTGTALNLQSASDYLIERCLFLENVAEVDQTGGAVRVMASSGEIRNCVFAYDSVYAASSGGGGIVVEGGTTTVTNNTFVGCHATLYGAAFQAMWGATGTFMNNVVAHSSGAPAVRFAAGITMTTGCNLFWQNPLGHYSPGLPGPTDVVADPLFCDLENLDFTVQADSPCLFPPTPACAPIGALGMGCGGVSIEPSSFGRVKSMFH